MALFLTHAADLERDPAMRRCGRCRCCRRAELAAELWLRTYRYDDARRDARAVAGGAAAADQPVRRAGADRRARQDAAAAAEAWRRVLELRASADADDTLRLEAQRALGPP